MSNQVMGFVATAELEVIRAAEVVADTDEDTEQNDG